MRNTFVINVSLIPIVVDNHVAGSYQPDLNSNEMTEKILFLTGKLALKRLQRVLQEMSDIEFEYEVRNIGVSVAALMTADMIQRRLDDYEHVDRIIVPGLCRGDLEAASKTLGKPILRGPVDLKDLPTFFGHDCKPVDLSRHNVLIFAEIVDAPQVTVEEVIQRALRYRRDGADVIDVGCLPDTPFPHLEDTVKALKEQGFKVSVDSLDENDLLRGGKAGADYLLSLKESTAWIADEVDSIPILIPEKHKDMDSLYRLIETFAAANKPFFADSILDPIHFGFTESIVRYQELRQNCPDIDIMVGVGNLTELTEADTTGINAVLFGIISELNANAVLATEVSSHACSAVREADIARRMMFAAREQNSLPKGLDNSLTTTHMRKAFPYTVDEIKELAEDVRDRNYRVQVSEEGVHVYNRSGHHVAADPFELFPELDEIQEDAPHAFYMGVELGRAQIAWQLKKRYVQDEELEWGALLPAKTEDDEERLSQNAHAIKQRKSLFKEEGSTVKASREQRKKKQQKNDS